MTSQFNTLNPPVFWALKTFLGCFLALCVFAGPLASGAWAAENPKYASIVMDADTGVILHQRYADKVLHPASLTKVMTLLLTFEAIEQGRLSMRDRIPISRHAASMSPSKLGLPAGASIKVEDAVYALVTKSANDIAVALAEHLGGTESNFARMMTARAQALGMTKTKFRNASGLHNPGQVSSARDMAKMARTVINTYPEYYRYFGTKNFNYKGKSYHNHNRLMSSYKGMDGMKTGYIAPSGFNLIASAVRGNHRLIGVVFGGRSAQSRNAHMTSLLDQGFAKVRKGGEMLIARADNIDTMPPEAFEPPAAAPLPPRKPGILIALQTLNKVAPAAGAALAPLKPPAPMQTASLVPSINSEHFAEMIGQGDYDPAVSRRFETGLMAIAAIKGEKMKPVPATLTAPASSAAKATPLKQNALLTAPDAKDSWAIQVGAFTSRAATDAILHETRAKLPAALSKGSPSIAPLKAGNAWLFRARLNGYTREEAIKACTYIPSCLPVSPQAN